jgi:hypothetical protein
MREVIERRRAVSRHAFTGGQKYATLKAITSMFGGMLCGDGHFLDGRKSEELRTASLQPSAS